MDIKEVAAMQQEQEKLTGDEIIQAVREVRKERAGTGELTAADIIAGIRAVRSGYSFEGMTESQIAEALKAQREAQRKYARDWAANHPENVKRHRENTKIRKALRTMGLIR